VGDVVGGYELVERIAVGGMAEVYIGRKSAGTPPVVVKRMLPQLEVSTDHVAMFVDEAHLGTILRHDNIVRVLDAGTDKGSHFMVLEYIDGPDLGQILKTARDAGAPLPIHIGAWVIARAADGLHHAHRATDPVKGASLGLVHRDVSPNNILVSRDGAVKVADFGVAKSGAQLHETKSGVVKGKVGYMSPEQINGGDVDARSDVLSLGVCLWETLTHRRMYAKLSEVEVMKKVCFESPPPPSLDNPAVPRELDAICMKALARSKRDRFQTAAELASALDSWGAKGRAELSAWMSERFHPRSIVADAATGWQFKSPQSPQLDQSALDEDPTRKLNQHGKLKPLKPGAATTGRKRDLVLYVEDELDNWQVAELRLKRNYDLIHAPDDKTACEILRTRGSELAAILMDIQLKGSELDGIALTKLVRGKLTNVPEHARNVPTLTIPVFFVTAYAARYTETELLSYGADKLVTKPVDFAQLTLALTSFPLRRAGARPPPNA
jgi:serine/threonine protein kinase